MGQILDNEISIAKEQIPNSDKLSEDRIFSYVLLKAMFKVSYSEADDYITDGPNDGGIDFVYYDDEEAKLILCQSKHVVKLQPTDVVTELNKMSNTISNFKLANTGSYNDRLKNVLQNAMDRLPDENSDNIEYDIFTSADIDIDQTLVKIENNKQGYFENSVQIYSISEIEKRIEDMYTSLETVSEAKIEIDRPKNYLEYSSPDNEGIMCNVSSQSIVKLYNKYVNKGLFDLNIRRYIRNKIVDDGITKTLNENRDNFWFFNNGIIIACDDFKIDGYVVHLYDFSIVNGGQTTTMIGTYKGSNKKEFYIPCKIVKTKRSDDVAEFFTSIAEATNSQKPIQVRDLKSNTKEMIRLNRILERYDIYLEIKRGVKPPKGKAYKYSLKNDEFGQIMLSFVYQRPGTSRNGKRYIFENSTIYSSIYRTNYFNDANMTDFIIDIIKLNKQYADIDQKLRDGYELSDKQKIVLKNGKQVIFSIFGVMYRLINNDIVELDLKNKPKDCLLQPFVYAKFISNYATDDYDIKLKKLVKNITVILEEIYNKAYKDGETTSVSNFFKTDQKYYDEIVKKFADYLSMMIGTDLKSDMVIFKR